MAIEWVDKKGRAVIIAERIGNPPLYAAMYYADPDGKWLKYVRGIKKSHDKTRLEEEIYRRFKRKGESK